VPSVAVVDGDLALSCPRSVTAASGLDALTQLLEAWFSPLASPLTDAWCESGVAHFARSFTQVLSDPGNSEARSGMALAAYLSGVGLANAGLGSVHALASPVGGRFPVPHGVVCGLLLEPAMRLNARLLADAVAKGTAQGEASRRILVKMARAGSVLGAGGAAGKGRDLAAPLLEFLAFYTEIAQLPRMGGWGVKGEDLDALAAKASTKTNPVTLTPEDYRELLAQVL
jgi:alcohol dehydrogenase class IV